MKNLNSELVKQISNIKGEPEWMLDFRLNSLKSFFALDNPSFGPNIDIDFNNINYYKKVSDLKDNWDNVDKDIKNTFNELGVIEAEEKYLCGVSNQYESEVVYHKNKFDNDNIIFTSTDEALKKYPELFKKYFNNLVKYDENKYTALNGALWSGGTFIYIPPFTKLDRPLQSYFRINSVSLGQFERTIIIVDEGAELSYIEGCTAPTYSENSLHAGVVEIYVGRNAKCKYSTIQNWSTDVYNLVTKRAIVEENGLMEWVDGNLGSKVTMKYPSCILKGDYSKGNSISIAYAKNGQYLDAGAKMIHIGKNTKSNIISKSIASSGGISNYRGTTKISNSANNSIASIKCDTILLDDKSISDTIPKNIVLNDTSIIEHEASVSKISEEKLLYLKEKGIDEETAKSMIIMGFINDFKNELPMEYAVELNRLMSGENVCKI
ncbi:MAG: Fe-S cluster assembly protein SufB [Bacilli bacterium]|nr:Fe-S cluster assembly protein SufB [Bacilli bacterium]